MMYDTNNFDSVSKASSIISNGGIIVYPTDTLYGLGVDATNTAAIESLNILKKRIQPYSIIVNSLDMLKKYAIINKNILKEINKCLPGPFTMILNKKKCDLSHLVSLKLDTVGLRIPKHNFPLNLVKSLKNPIITTSVNIHNQKSLYNLEMIKDQFNSLDVFFDDKINKNSKGSTIIDFSNEKVKILRQGDGVYRV